MLPAIGGRDRRAVRASSRAATTSRASAPLELGRVRALHRRNLYRDGRRRSCRAPRGRSARGQGAPVRREPRPRVVAGRGRLVPRDGRARRSRPRGTIEDVRGRRAPAGQPLVDPARSRACCARASADDAERARARRARRCAGGPRRRSRTTRRRWRRSDFCSRRAARAARVRAAQCCRARPVPARRRGSGATARCTTRRCCTKTAKRSWRCGRTGWC